MNDFTSSTVLYHPSGARCTLTLPTNPQEAFDMVGAYIDAGFLAGMPTPSEGEKLHVDFVVRCKFVGKNNEPKERLYFYDTTSQFTGSAMTVYLDKAETIAAFEKTAGFTVESMPFMKGKVAPAYDSGEYFDNLAKRVDFTVTRKKVDDPKAPQGYHFELVGYVDSGKASVMPSSAPKQPLISTNGNESNDLPQTAKDKAIAWAKSKGFDTSRYPYGNGDAHSEIIAKAWCEAIFKQQGNVEATG